MYLARWEAAGLQVRVSLPAGRHPSSVDQHAAAPLLIHQRCDQHIPAHDNTGQKLILLSSHSRTALHLNRPMVLSKCYSWQQSAHVAHKSQCMHAQCMPYPDCVVPMTERGRGPTRMLRSCFSSPSQITRWYSFSFSDDCKILMGSPCACTMFRSQCYMPLQQTWHIP